MAKQKPGPAVTKPAAAVTQADAAALTGTPTPAPTPATQPAPFLSEGMRADLEMVGWAVDPISGARYTLDRETGQVTVTERGVVNPVSGETAEGKVSAVDVEVSVRDVDLSSTDPETGVVTTIDPETGAVTTHDPETGATVVRQADGTETASNA